MIEKVEAIRLQLEALEGSQGMAKEYLDDPLADDMAASMEQP